MKILADEAIQNITEILIKINENIVKIKCPFNNMKKKCELCAKIRF